MSQFQDLKTLRCESLLPGGDTLRLQLIYLRLLNLEFNCDKDLRNVHSDILFSILSLSLLLLSA